MSTGVCSCRIDMSNRAMSLVEPANKFKATGTCPGFSAKNYGLSVLDSVLMGLPSLAGAVEQPKVDDTALRNIQTKNEELKTMFQACQFQISNCRMQQSVDFLSKQMELNKALQSITDETQDQLIAKNTSLTYYSIAIGTLAIIYILAMPSNPLTASS